MSSQMQSVSGPGSLLLVTGYAVWPTLGQRRHTETARPHVLLALGRIKGPRHRPSPICAPSAHPGGAGGFQSWSLSPDSPGTHRRPSLTKSRVVLTENTTSAVGGGVLLTGDNVTTHCSLDARGRLFLYNPHISPRSPFVICSIHLDNSLPCPRIW